MNNTPRGNRKHVVLYGKTNSGKSSLFNKLCNSNISIVSEREGTTTDPVSKGVELIPVGPVLYIDTAGLEDNTVLGDLRVNKTLELLKRTDIALYIIDGKDKDLSSFNKMKKEFKKYNIPYLLVINKVDILENDEIKEIKKDYENGIFISAKDDSGIEEVKEKLIELIEKEEEELPLIGDLLPYGSKVILVVPIDSEAPKGRLILPQVQCIRDCLDHGIKSYVVRDTELEEALEEIKYVDLVITDSQAFKFVDEIVPKDIMLTSFSMLFARQKGDINEFINGVWGVRNLKPGDKVLISESCSHNVSHEDIGRVKIPTLLEKYVGGKLDFEFKIGYDFAEDIGDYKLIIHCGGCMVNRKTILNRINLCKERKVYITNYGVLLSFLTNTLERSKVIFN
ncbi:[FeFe] hydrogenase H-cluster maturation GTPase HydF [Clostridium paraputrificum]|uniref:[FeFe] hydrogenase H-cluster maturation GTPase HydF n=1 Tax=Clostridium TaxID=1485 RepID=UPI00189D948C|nr:MULTISPECIES: [FeFe] hydrogenase H-cluster maturation GTPase HydF [Clostridium]MDB2076880.1 [FeFe] hydrogenase H-cluster maturation GTPase HydF [Clostridium paraputrificum]MDB2080427.1 [FeFe] hydrogenase H-cluster maturation GTPase HydF [Clostridium paraputrificum]MDB2086684.1 [FeFe] hydrogenase H-cluster maturation GTPase HydF [Clostridium paraputrificum]MDB2099557.1 [FeFe] hydrogenase H-cluster maturation GTPase HydF [Clostridium paraputrificum]MDU1033930.1 [FeFe] hydrogenase H-cluster ma